MNPANRRVSTIAYAALAVVALGAACLVLQAQQHGVAGRAAGQASISMLDVGQGDSFLIQAASGAQLLIDGGPDETVLTELSKVMPPGDRSIDAVIATHYDSDHIGGLPLVLERYDVGLFLATQAETNSEIYRTLMNTVSDRHVPAYYARHGMTLTLDGGDSTRPRALFSILFPDRDTTGWETNTASVVGRLQVGAKTALFTGDSPASVEVFLAAAIPNDVNVDILKLGHHGSKTSSSEIFLRAVTPSLSLISAGIDNKFGHPASETVARLKSLGIPWVSTQNVGTYTITTDGTKWYEQ